jgi:hypothetical protein
MRMNEFQKMTLAWMHKCFGKEITENRVERGLRVVEEAIELGQSAGLTKEQVLKLVEWVYSRPAGDLLQESGGVLITLSAFCSAHGIRLEDSAQRELFRCVQGTRKIQKKQREKREAGIAIGVLVVDKKPEYKKTDEGDENKSAASSDESASGSAEQALGTGV